MCYELSFYKYLLGTPMVLSFCLLVMFRAVGDDHALKP